MFSDPYVSFTITNFIAAVVFILGVGWLIHTAWDMYLHVNGHGLTHGGSVMVTYGCAAFDTFIAVWFLAGAPALICRRDKDHVDPSPV